MTEKKYGRDTSGIEVAGTSALVLRDGIRNDLKVLKKTDEFVNAMYDKSYFESVKFDFIILVFLYGIKLDLKPQYDRIKKDKYGIDLGMYLELDVEIMRWCDKNDLDLMEEIFLIATCEAVLHALRKYKLPTEPVEKRRAQFGDIPLTIEACQARSQELKAQKPSA